MSCGFGSPRIVVCATKMTNLILLIDCDTSMKLNHYPFVHPVSLDCKSWIMEYAISMRKRRLPTVWHETTPCIYSLFVFTVCLIHPRYSSLKSSTCHLYQHLYSLSLLWHWPAGYCFVRSGANTNTHLDRLLNQSLAMRLTSQRKNHGSRI